MQFSCQYQVVFPCFIKTIFFHYSTLWKKIVYIKLDFIKTVSVKFFSNLYISYLSSTKDSLLYYNNHYRTDYSISDGKITYYDYAEDKIGLNKEDTITATYTLNEDGNNSTVTIKFTSGDLKDKEYTLKLNLSSDIYSYSKTTN